MALPNLRTLTTCVDDPKEGNMLFSGTPGTSGITQLELVGGVVSHEMLGGILKIPRSLASFIYRVPSEFSFNLGNLGRALRPLRESLAHLVLDFTRVARGDVDDIDNDDGTIGTFRHWRRLESLDCPLMLLFGRGPTSVLSTSLRKLLPPGLNSLRLRDHDHWNAVQVVDQLLFLLRFELLNLGPRMLRTVTVGTVPNVYRGRLAKVCKAAGVALVK